MRLKKIMEEIPLVFVPGYKGSHLYHKTTRHHSFLTIKNAISWDTPNLRLPLKWHEVTGENGETYWKQEETEFVAGDPLHSASALLGLFHVDIYGSFLDEMKASKRPFYSFTYDWRRSNNETAEKLVSFLEEVSQKHANKKVQVVAHSMGGLLTWSVLGRRPELFHSILFAGVPFVAGRGLFWHLHYGDPIGRNRKILSSRVSFSFPSAFCFFPPTHEAIVKGDSGVCDPEGNLLMVDYYDANFWREHKIGIFADEEGLTKEEQEEYFQHLTCALKDAKRFRDTLHFTSDDQRPPMHVLIGNKIPVAGKILTDRTHPKNHRGFRFCEESRAPGDGTMPAYIASLPESIKHKAIMSDRNHMTLLNDVKVVAQSLRELYEEAEALNSQSLERAPDHANSKNLEHAPDQVTLPSSEQENGQVKS
eukprot:Colp12_sorted_trinity150504_noHs@4682